MIITGTSVYMTRGDTEVLTVSCPAKPFQTGDVVELTIRMSAGYGPSLIHKKVTSFTEEGKALIVFEPQDLFPHPPQVSKRPSCVVTAHGKFPLRVLTLRTLRVVPTVVLSCF